MTKAWLVQHLPSFLASETRERMASTILETGSALRMVFELGRKWEKEKTDGSDKKRDHEG